MVLQDTISQTFFTIDKINKNNKINKKSKKIRYICDFNIVVDYFNPITTIKKDIVFKSFIKKKRIFKYSISSKEDSFIKNNNLRVPTPICNNIHTMFKPFQHKIKAIVTNIYFIDS